MNWERRCRLTLPRHSNSKTYLNSGPQIWRPSVGAGWDLTDEVSKILFVFSSILYFVVLFFNDWENFDKSSWIYLMITFSRGLNRNSRE